MEFSKSDWGGTFVVIFVGLFAWHLSKNIYDVLHTMGAAVLFFLASNSWERRARYDEGELKFKSAISIAIYSLGHAFIVMSGVRLVTEKLNEHLHHIATSNLKLFFLYAVGIYFVNYTWRET